MQKSNNTLMISVWSFIFKPQPVQPRSIATFAHHSRAREEEQPEQLPEVQFYVENYY